MKKMVCEICESQSIKKENGIFVCKECGTEYSLEEAKKLLKDVLDDKVVVATENKQKSVNVLSENDKYELLKKLCLWAYLLKSCDSFTELKFDTQSESFWSLNEENLNELVKDRLPGSISKYNIYLKNAYSNSSSTSDSGDSFTDRVRNYYLNKMKLTEADIPISVKNEFLYWHGKAGKYSYLSNTGFMIGMTQYNCSNYDTNDLVQKACDTKTTLLDWCYKLASYASNNEDMFIWKVAIFTKDDHNLKKCGDSINSIIELKSKLYEKEKNEKLNPAIAQRKKELLKLVKASKDLENIFRLPFEYRTLEAVFFMIKAIYDGKVESWKEAALLLDEANFRSSMLYSMSEISNQLSIINNKITVGFTIISQQLSVISDHLVEINNDIKESNASLKAIGVFSAMTAYDSY